MTFAFNNGVLEVSDPLLQLALETHPQNGSNNLTPEQIKDKWREYYAKIINDKIQFFELQKK